MQMTYSPYQKLAGLAVVALGVGLAYSYFMGFFEEGVDVKMVSSRCMRNGGSGPMGGAGLHGVKNKDWSSAAAVPLGEEVVLKGITLQKQAMRGRVLAGPGSTVELDGQSIVVDDILLQHELPPHGRPGASHYFLEHLDGIVYKVVYNTLNGLPQRTFTVGHDELFVLGDERSQFCLDLLGVVPFSDIQGGW
jgi:hypothetical protein